MSEEPRDRSPSSQTFRLFGRRFEVILRSVPQLRQLFRADAEMKRQYRAQVESTRDHPTSVVLNRRSAELRQHAQALAGAGREDAGAVRELAAIAGSDPTDARVAALWFREDSWSLENREADRACRLLTAVADNADLKAPSSEDLERFDRLERFAALSDEEAFRELVGLEPRLADLEQEAKAGRLGARVGAELIARARAADKRNPQPRYSSETTRALMDAELEADRLLAEALDPLVGLSAESRQELLRTNLAHNKAASHLEDVRPP